MIHLPHGAKIGALLLLLASAQSAGCMEHKVGGNTAEQEFTEPRLAALARAACVGDKAGVARALKSGADPNGIGFEGVTPLLWAVNCENLHGIEALLQAGADPNHKIPGKFSPTYAAATMWNPAPLRLLLKYRGDPNAIKGDDLSQSALSEALDLGWGGHGWDNYYSLLNAGANINRADSVGNTIATHAVALGRYDKVAELLERGYNYDLVDLGAHVQVGEGPSDLPEAAAGRAKVKAMLEQRGVRFPVPPRNQR